MPDAEDIAPNDDGQPGVPVAGASGLRAGLANGSGLLGLARLSPPGDGAGPDPDFKFCPPTPARIMQGNADNVGSLKGGWGPQRPVTADGTAVDPSQWGGKGALRPYLDRISGPLADGTPLFDGVSEVIGGKRETINGTTYDAAHVRDGIKAAYPGQLLLEIPDQNDMGTKMVVLRVPRELNCPQP